MHKDNYYSGRLADAMLHLPNLEEIFLSLDQWGDSISKALRKFYRDCFVVPKGHNDWTEPRGIPQMLSLLQGSARTEMKLKTLWWHH